MPELVPHAGRTPATEVPAVPVFRPPGAEPPAYTDIDWSLSPATLKRIENAPARSTLTIYRKWIAEWRGWCELHGRVPLPATPHTLAEWASELADRGTGIPSLRHAVAAVRFLHATSGYEGHPPGKLASLIRKTHAREQARAGVRVRRAAPIMTQHIPALLAACPTSTLRGRRDRALLVLGWGAFLRRSEIANLRVHDVHLNHNGDLSVYIAWSKTDQAGEGETVTVARRMFDDVADAVHEWQQYMDMLSEVDSTAGYLLRGFDLGGRVLARMTGHGVNQAVHDMVRIARLPHPERYSAHSLRAGGASSAYKAGWPLARIAQQGRWAIGSPVLMGYIREVEKAEGGITVQRHG